MPSLREVDRPQPPTGIALLPAGLGGPPGEEPRWLRFSRPREILAAATAAEVSPLLAAVDRALDRGLWAAGWIAYEAAPAFDPAFVTRPPGPGPLALFGLFTAPERVPSPAVAAPAAALIELPPPRAWRAELGPREHAAAIGAIRAAIARGDTYQVNLTFRLRRRFAGDPWPLFLALAASGQARHGGYLDLGGPVVASASPELLFALDGERIESRPMKGTAPRGRFAADDARLARRLAASAKERAENLMIVDMVRHDLGRIARPGSVTVPTLFAVERYATVHQMTSTVAARTDAPLSAILAALFPPSSITGAPKAATMRLIAALETSPRGLYTGALGWASPDRRAAFGVAIRTVAVDRARRLALCGVGSGVVWDSRAPREWRECRAKRLFLGGAGPPFRLLETMRRSPARGIARRERHLDRLLASADYFDFRCDRGRLDRELDAWLLERAEGEGAAAPLRVRLLLARDGTLAIESAPAPPRRRTVTVALGDAPVDARDPFLCHKTTRREVHDRARAAHPEADDVLLWNRRRELTESTIANLLLRLDGRWYTPPVACGLLPGVLRGALLDRRWVAERRLPVAALADAEAVVLASSLRGLVRAQLLPGAVARVAPSA